MGEHSLPNNTEEFQDPLENYDPKTYSDPLEQALAEKAVANIQHRPVVAVSPDTSVSDAIAKMIEMHVGCLLIEEEGRLVGVFSDRDVLERAALEYDEVKSKPVGDLMSDDPVFVYESDSSAAALSVMAVCGLRHVPVTDLEGRILGIISPHRVTTFLRKHVFE